MSERLGRRPGVHSRAPRRGQCLPKVRAQRQGWDQYVIILERFPDHTEAKEEMLSLDWRADAAREAFFAECTRRNRRGD